MATARLGSLDQAARHLGRLLALARDRYSHIGNGTGTAVVSAGALLAARGELGPSLEVFQGSLTTRLAARSEMAWVTALHYVEHLSSQLGPEALPHLRRGRSLSREALLAITKGVAAAVP